MKPQAILRATVGLLLLPFLAGCGGGATTGAASSGAASKAASGGATFTIKWPLRPTTKLIPLACNSINVAVTQAGTTYTSQLVARPTTGNTSTVTFDVLPAGTLGISATAFPGADGSGVAQATASAPLIIQAGKTTSFSLTMNTTITHVQIAKVYPVWNGRSTVLSAAAYDANNNVVLTAPSTWTWKSSAPGVATITTSTNTPSITGVSVGSTTLTATEGESGASTTATASVITPGPAITQWAKYQGNGRNTGVGSGTGAAGSLKWNFATGGTVFSSEAIGLDGTVYFGSSDHVLYALNPDGTLKWSFKTNGDVTCPVLGADGTIYVGSGDSNVYAINADGTLKWSTATISGIYSNPTIGADGTIYACSYKGTLTALDGLTGKQKWTFTTGNYIYASPAIASDGTLYIGCDSPTANISSPTNLIFAINPDGSKKWSAGGGYGYDSAAGIGADGTVYVGTNDGYVHALNPTNGVEKASILAVTGTNIHPSAPAIASDGTVYFGATDGHLYSFTSGLTLNWSFPVGGNFVSDPAIGGDGTIYVGYNDGAGNGQYFAVTPAGTQKWVYNSGSVNASSAVGSDGTIYLSDGVNLTALK